MDYIAIKNKNRKVYTLSIDEPLIVSKEQFVDFITKWLYDMGCPTVDCVFRAFKPTLESVYGRAFTNSECHHSHYHLDISRTTNGFMITFTVIEEELTYILKNKDENKNN